MATVYLGLGTNLGNREQNITEAIIRLAAEAGEVLRQSAFFYSKPWGFQSDNDFVNIVVSIETQLSPFQLLTKTQEIELNLGRTSKSHHGYSDRIIDIDILLYDDLVINDPILKIPHPLIAERDFVLLPLVEISPSLINPVSGLEFRQSIPLR